VLFGKHAQGLDRIESALLAALVRAPNSPSSGVARRACALLASTAGVNRAAAATPMPRDEAERDCLIAQGLAAEGLRARNIEFGVEGTAPHLAHKLVKRPGENVTSTLDARVQRYARESLQRHIRELEHRNVEDGALVVLDNETGNVLAWVGSSGEISSARDVDGVVAPRQAGSTLKPFLYALAIEQRMLTAASVLDDSPLAVTLPTGLYVPQNYDHAFKGRVSLRQALASSLNVPAVRTLALIGYEPFYRKLKNLGFDTLTRDADHYGYSLALGGADVTLLALTNAYRALANGGELTDVAVVPEGKEVSEGTRPETVMLGFLPRRSPDRAARRVIDLRAAFVVSDILADPAARALTFGFASPLATRYRSSVKTGTSKDMRDNWAVGFAGRYTVGVWVGNFSGAPMHDVSGIDGAAPVWREVMDMLQEGAMPGDRQPPEGLTRSRLTYSGGLEPEREEWFISGTERSTVTTLPARSMHARIESPAQGAIYAIDPDIPRGRQRLTVSARGAPKGARLVLEDGRRVRADKPLLWLPQPGKREVVLIGAKGEELDRVRFEVRGLQPRRSK
jgi:penicillin-binding protein 1C